MKKYLVTLLLTGLACVGLMACGGSADVATPPLTQGDDYYVYNQDVDYESDWQTPEAEPTMEPTKEPTATPTATPIPTPTPVPTKKYGMTTGAGTYGFNYDLDSDYLYYAFNYDSATLYRANIHTGAVEIMATDLGDYTEFIIANGNIYYRNKDNKTWYSVSLATGEKKALPFDRYASDVYIYENMAFYSRTVDVSATTTEKQLVQVKDFESDKPMERVLCSTRDGYYGMHRANEDGSFLVEVSMTEFEKGSVWRRLYEYLAFSPEGEQIDIPAYRGYQTFMKDDKKMGVGWIGTSIEEAYDYGFVDDNGKVYIDKNVAEIFKKDPACFISGDTLFYADKEGIHAYGMNSGEYTDIVADPGRIVVVAGNYVYYNYSNDIYRIKTDGTGWKHIGRN